MCHVIVLVLDIFEVRRIIKPPSYSNLALELVKCAISIAQFLVLD